MKSVDVLVIGGGISGVGIARDLAGRGIDVMLCEKSDLGGATSSATSKIIHGGLSHLEYLNISMTREALKERESLLRAAPHLVRPMDFIIPNNSNMPSRILTKAALFLYDNLLRNKDFPKSREIDLSNDRKGEPLLDDYKTGYMYTDCWVDDARLVIANAIDAHEKGAVICPHTECMYIETPEDKIGWIVSLKDNLNDKKYKIFAKVVINATGAWVNDLLDRVDNGIITHNIRWVKGSHIIVKQLYLGDYSYVLKLEKGKEVFVMPYEGGHTLIGSTDVDYTGDINKVQADSYEVNMLCDTVNQFFKKKITVADVEWTYSGVRPILDDKGEAVSKVMSDYIIEANEHQGAKIISIYGGKLSSYRKLAEEVSNNVCEILGDIKGIAWTANSELPGAEGHSLVFASFFKAFMRDYSWLPRALATRYAISYGVRARDMLEGAKSEKDMGFYFGDGLYEREVQYLMKKEWAISADDILFRRTKLGMHLTKETINNLERYMDTI